MITLSTVALSDLYDVTRDPAPVSNFAYSIIEHQYPTDLLLQIARRACELESQAQGEFLGLKHLRAAQTMIGEVEELMFCEARLQFLSDLCGAELEPYPLTRAGAHINYYEGNVEPIDFHSDGPPFVELIPVLIAGKDHGGATLVYRGSPREGLYSKRLGIRPPSEAVISIPHSVGRSVFMQGRSLFHAAARFSEGRRITLVLPLRSKAQPWKDNNTLERLLLDDPPEAVINEWVSDAINRRLPSLRAALTDVD
jgi:hypothetical protein